MFSLSFRGRVGEDTLWCGSWSGSVHSLSSPSKGAGLVGAMGPMVPYGRSPQQADPWGQPGAERPVFVMCSFLHPPFYIFV